MSGRGERSPEPNPATVVGKIVEELEAAIFSGQLAPGARIPEARVAADLGVGRGPVREALQRLEGRRIVVREPNCGITVAKLSHEELIELLAVREILEVAACRLAAKRITDDELESLRRTLARQAESADKAQSQRFYRLNANWQTYDFHFQVAQASGNKRLTDLLCGDVWFLLRSYRFPGILSPGRLSVGYADHEGILAALEAHDADLCERLTREHLGHFREALEEQRAYRL